MYFGGLWAFSFSAFAVASFRLFLAGFASPSSSCLVAASSGLHGGGLTAGFPKKAALGYLKDEIVRVRGWRLGAIITRAYEVELRGFNLGSRSPSSLSTRATPISRLNWPFDSNLGTLKSYSLCKV